MAPGVAEYREPKKEPYRVFIGEETIKNMDPSFAGRPVYVHHVDEVNLEEIEAEAEGYVVESFFNRADGKHWVKFIVISDEAKSAIKRGWKLSNAYVPKSLASGGLWHGVEYSKEIMNAEYEHLAIVPNPRYEESVILTPEQFKAYCGEKEQELKRLANSVNEKGETSMFNFFKKTKVENSADLGSTSVLLPKSKKEMTVLEALEAFDKHLNDIGMPEHMANTEHHVMVGEEKMKINDLVGKHMAMCQELEAFKKKAAPDDDAAAQEDGGEPIAKKEEGMKNEEDDKKKKEKEEAEKMKNSADDKVKAKAAADAKAAEEKANFESLKNAASAAAKAAPVQTIHLSSDRVAAGKSRYGSN